MKIENIKLPRKTTSSKVELNLRDSANFKIAFSPILLSVQEKFSFKMSDLKTTQIFFKSYFLVILNLIK